MKNRILYDKEIEEVLFDFCYICFLCEIFFCNVYDILYNGVSNSDKFKLVV